MKNYLGTKIIKAEPMTNVDFYNIIKEQPNDPDMDAIEGYHVVYPNPGGETYDSWSPKRVFDTAYRQITMDELCFLGFGGSSETTSNEHNTPNCRPPERAQQ